MPALENAREGLLQSARKGRRCTEIKLEKKKNKGKKVVRFANASDKLPFVNMRGSAYRSSDLI